MKKSTNVLIQCVSDTLAAYAVEKKLAFSFNNEPITIEETFWEYGALVVFLHEAKHHYEFIYKNEFVCSIFPYDESQSFPLKIIKTGSFESFFDHIPDLYSMKNFEAVLVFTMHSLIRLVEHHKNELFIPIDDMWERFMKSLPKK